MMRKKLVELFKLLEYLNEKGWQETVIVSAEFSEWEKSDLKLLIPREDDIRDYDLLIRSVISKLSKFENRPVEYVVTDIMQGEIQKGIPDLLYVLSSFAFVFIFSFSLGILTGRYLSILEAFLIFVLFLLRRGAQVYFESDRKQNRLS